MVLFRGGLYIPPSRDEDIGDWALRDVRSGTLSSSAQVRLLAGPSMHSGDRLLSRSKSIQITAILSVWQIKQMISRGTDIFKRYEWIKFPRLRGLKAYRHGDPPTRTRATPPRHVAPVSLFKSLFRCLVYMVKD
jgi:hypothetical protein